MARTGVGHYRWARTAAWLAGEIAQLEPAPAQAELLRRWLEAFGPHASVLFDTNGNAGPTVWGDGRVVGGWSQRRDGEIAFRLLDDVGADAVRAVESEAVRLATRLGEVRFSPGSLPPFQRGLSA